MDLQNVKWIDFISIYYLRSTIFLFFSIVGRAGGFVMSWGEVGGAHSGAAEALSSLGNIEIRSYNLGYSSNTL